MHKHIIILTTFLLLTLGAAAQPYGDTVRAKLASHHPEMSRPGWRVQLGYIDTLVATRQQFLDNMEVGLRLAGDYPPGVEITEYTISWLQKGGDYHTGIQVKKGGRVPISVFKGNHVDDVKAGDRVFIEGIKAKVNGLDRALNTVVLRII